MAILAMGQVAVRAVLRLIDATLERHNADAAEAWVTAKAATYKAEVSSKEAIAA